MRKRMDHILRKQNLTYMIDTLLRVPPFFIMDMICSSKRCFTVNGWLTFVTSITFILKFPYYLKSGTLLMNTPYPSLENILYFVLQIFGKGVISILILRLIFLIKENYQLRIFN